MNAPTLETQRLTLRPFVDADVDALVREILSDSDVMATLPEMPAGPEEQRLCAKEEFVDGFSSLWETHGYGGWAVCSRDMDIAPEGKFLGFCGFSPSPEEIEGAELTYGYGKVCWGKGVGTEAAKAAVEWLFRVAGHERVFACHYKGNAPSKRIIEGLGMVHVGDLDVWNAVADGRGLMPSYAIDRNDYLAMFS